MSESALDLKLSAKDWKKDVLLNSTIFIKDGTHGTHKRVEIGVPLLSAVNITASGKIKWGADVSKVSVRDYDKIHSKYSLQKKDLLITVVGTLGRSAVISDSRKFTLQRSVGIVRTDETKLLSTFLFQFTKGQYFQNQLILRSNATAQAGVYLGELGKIEVPFPPLPEQQKIAKILTSVDEVIETTETQINKLKDLKKGLMNELLTKGIGHTEFKDSPVGRIPVGWECVKLGSVTILARGKFSHRPRNDPKFYGGKIPFIQTGDVPKESPFIDKYSQTLNEKGKEISKLFSKGTLVITIAATIGEIGILKFDSCFPDSLIGISVDILKTVSGFILYVMRFHKDTLISYAPQTAQKNVNLEILSPFLIPLPPLKEQHKIASILTSIDTNIEQKQTKLTQSKNLKKSLMADLLTGRVRVKLNEYQESL